MVGELVSSHADHPWNGERPDVEVKLGPHHCEQGFGRDILCDRAIAGPVHHVAIHLGKECLVPLEETLATLDAAAHGPIVVLSGSLPSDAELWSRPPQSGFQRRRGCALSVATSPSHLPTLRHWGTRV